MNLENVKESDLFFLKILAVDDGDPPKTATATLTVIVQV